MSNQAVIRNTEEGRHELVCPSCGEKYAPALPIAMDDFIALCNSFATRHSICDVTAAVKAAVKAPENAGRRAVIVRSGEG